MTKKQLKYERRLLRRRCLQLRLLEATLGNVDPAAAQEEERVYLSDLNWRAKR